MTLTMDPCNPRGTKSLLVYEMGLDFLQLICNLDINTIWFHMSIPFSRFSHEAHRNMKESSIKACDTTCIPPPPTHTMGLPWGIHISSHNGTPLRDHHTHTRINENAHDLRYVRLIST